MTDNIFDFSHVPVLETERLHLRQMTVDDADTLVELYTDPKVLEFLIMEPYPCSNRDEATTMIEWIDDIFFREKGAARWAITLRENPSRLIGTIGFHFFERRDRKVDIGYDLMPAYWNTGITTEATHAVVRWSFENLNLHRVQADCTDGNMGSERVLLKVGFQVEGLWRESCFEHGRFVNIKQFGLLRREYMPGA